MSSLSEPTYLLDDHAMREAAKRIGQGVDAEAVCKLIRDTYEAELDRLRQQVADLEAQVKGLLELNERNVNDALRRIRAGDSSLELAGIAITELGKSEARVAELEAQLAEEKERDKHYYSETADIVIELTKQNEQLKAQLVVASQWQPLPDGRYGGESPDGSDKWWLRVSDNGDTLEQWSDSDKEEVEIGSLSFFNVRLCRSTSAAGE